MVSGENILVSMFADTSQEYFQSRQQHQKRPIISTGFKQRCNTWHHSRFLPVVFLNWFLLFFVKSFFGFLFNFILISCLSSDYNVCLDDALLLYLEKLLVPSSPASHSSEEISVAESSKNLSDKQMEKVSRVVDALIEHDMFCYKLADILKKVICDVLLGFL